MTQAEADMLFINGVLSYDKLYGDYKDLSIHEALEAEYGSVGPYIDVDETLTFRT